MKKIILASILFTALWSCDNKIVQYPVSYQNDDFMTRSQERNKSLLKEEIEWFNNYKEKSDLSFTKTESGLWISNQGKKSETTAKSGDFINFTYQIYDLDNNVIYNYNEIGEEKIILGKAGIIRGLHSALQLIEEGQEARILVPSFLGYSGLGDDDKITPNQPLVIDVKINQITKK